METPYYYRPLSWYFRALKAADLAVTAFEEPESTEEFAKESPQGAYLPEVPLHCVIEAHKLGT